MSRQSVLYQVNTRVWLTELSRELDRRATLDDIPDKRLDELVGLGVEWVWFLGVWRTGAAGAQISRHNAEWRREFEQTLTDLEDRDIRGSCFAITAYEVADEDGGSDALIRLRHRLNCRGLRLMLDFVPNHTALDHAWVKLHPDFYVGGNESLLQEQPHNYVRLADRRILAYGRDPYFSGWPDTAQLDYANPELQRAMLLELLSVASQCDGVRCDMAMLILPEVFERTWGKRASAFWPWAIEQARRLFPRFVFMAEVYWDLEWELQQQGFDFTYDKRLYDRLRAGLAAPVRAHLHAELGFQNRLARFLENHDEARAASAFSPDMHEAAAVLTFLTPGLRFLHDGQLEGRTRRVSPHLVRAPLEPLDQGRRDFYRRLLKLFKHRALGFGKWQLLDSAPAWQGNASFDCLLAWSWVAEKECLLVVVNFAPHASQGFVSLPLVHAGDGEYRLRDLMHSLSYFRAADDLATRGLYLDMDAWSYHVFEISPPYVRHEQPPCRPASELASDVSPMARV